MTNTYIIYELQNLESVCRGTRYKGSLTAAKRAASRGQTFQQTVLKITDEDGNTIATKRWGHKWQDANI